MSAVAANVGLRTAAASFCTSFDQSCFLTSPTSSPEAHSQAMALMAPHEVLDPLRGQLRPGQVAISLFPKVRTEMKRLCAKGALQDPYICKKDQRLKADVLVDQQLLLLLQSSDEMSYLRGLQLSCGGHSRAKMADNWGKRDRMKQRLFSRSVFKNFASPKRQTHAQATVWTTLQAHGRLELARMNVEAYTPLNQLIDRFQLDFLG